jgi:POLQ-like helicase
MKPELSSQRLLGIARSKAKMYEYDVPEPYHIKIPRDPANLFPLTIGLLGDLAARTDLQVRVENDADDNGKELLFSAQFFDNFLNTRLRQDLDPYLRLLASASYYLCDLPGSSQVLAKQLGEARLDLGCRGLEYLLQWLLQEEPSRYLDGSGGPYGKDIDGISRSMALYLQKGSTQNELFEHAAGLRRAAYGIGEPRQLLLADLCCAVVKKRFQNSTWFCLPRYSDLSIEHWHDALKKQSFVRELWPSQRLLGDHGVFRGRSAVVQMPTSAGKTKAIEIIVRSAFLSGRTSLATIVAPFRALCHEIRADLRTAFRNEQIDVRELSDVFQVDFDVTTLLGKKQVLVVTPEKLVYVLRHAPELAKHIGLLIYDEGHLFDNGTRGVTYELLLTSLKTMIPKEVQTILISAVIMNAAAVGKWLNGEGSEVISGTNLIPTYRSIGFASWRDVRGRLEFVTQADPDTGEFFVPRVIEQQQLEKRGRERNRRVFPDKTDGQAVALYLGLRLVPKGSVAVFCGTKPTAAKLCEKIVEEYERGLSLKRPIDYSDEDEVRRLYFLHERNLGSQAKATQSAALGIFPHHGNTPHGIRLAVEHAMKKSLAKFVICTSTLAQGVNLPIRYLIVTSIYQGRDQIKVRDFHNLIGRAGRSGMYTEGSILFADPEVYDERNRANWRWEQVKNLLEPSNSEPCTSALASISDPLRSDDRKSEIRMEPLELVRRYTADQVEEVVEEIVRRFGDRGFSPNELREQVAWKTGIIAAVESYLMTHWDPAAAESQGRDVADLAKETLAYSLGDEEQKNQIIELFRLLAQNAEQKIPEAPKRRAFGRTLYGVQDCVAIEEWVTQHVEPIRASGNPEELLVTLWPLMLDKIRNNTFRSCNPSEPLQELALRWIRGEPFHDLFRFLESKGVRIGAGQHPRRPKIEHVVDICENALSYDGMLLVGAVAEIVQIINFEGGDGLVRNLQDLQKRLKYGLSSFSAITLCELGFADRVVSTELASLIGIDTPIRGAAVVALGVHGQEVRVALAKYPRYFTEIAAEVINWAER